MGSNAEEKWALMRVLYEHHAVSLDMISKIAGAGPGFVERTAIAQHWRPGANGSVGHARLAKALDEQLCRLQSGAADEMAEEKRARTMSIMAKTLESLTAMETRLINSGEQKDKKESPPPDEATTLDAERLLQLDVELEKAIGALVDEGQGEGAPQLSG